VGAHREKHEEGNLWEREGRRVNYNAKQAVWTVTVF
jgi:hypothetical protein